MRVSSSVAFGLALTALVAAATPAAGQARQTSPATLDVPYLTQTPLLCGGAAAAMVLRYWGDRRADVQQFASLVDTRAGGINDDELATALAARGWQTERFSGSMDRLASELAAGHPLILLLADRGTRHHYVVAVGADADHVVVHDPTWGPAREIHRRDLDRQWKAADYRALLVLPGDGVTAHADSPPEVSALDPSHQGATGEVRLACERYVDEAIDQVIDGGAAGLQGADEILLAASRRCPGSSRPLSELAAVRFAQSRPREAAQLAEHALRVNTHDEYAWEVLGSSRFLLNDVPGALSAWNRIGRPRLDSVQISGLTRTRYATVAEALDLTPNDVLSSRAFQLAERRLHDLPDQIAARLDARPDGDGFATVDVALQERTHHPIGIVGWSAALGQAAVNREARVTAPGWSGQGDTWTARWRWWENRPHLGMTFSAPRTGLWPGVWSVSGAWDRQTYAVAGSGVNGDRTLQENRATASIGVSHWIAPSLRYRVTFGADRWKTDGGFLSAAAGLDARGFADRLSMTIDVDHWAPVVSHDHPFSTLDLRASLRTSTRTEGLVGTGSVSMTRATSSAPLAVWSGAGEGVARVDLLRAHPLLDDGVVTGATFGRQLEAMTGEVQRWLHPSPLTPLALAGFVDVARAAHGLGDRASGVNVDVGGGMRLRAPGREGMLRFDYAYGLRDGAHAVTVGWTP